MRRYEFISHCTLVPPIVGAPGGNRGARARRAARRNKETAAVPLHKKLKLAWGPPGRREIRVVHHVAKEFQEIGVNLFGGDGNLGKLVDYWEEDASGYFWSWTLSPCHQATLPPGLLNQNHRHFWLMKL